MAIQVINIGASPNDGTGDPLRTAMDKANDNFAFLEGEIGSIVSGPPPIVEVPDDTTFTLISDHDGVILWIDQSTDIDFTLPDSLDEDFQVSIVGYTSDDITFTAGGTSTLSPSGYTLTGTTGVPVALSLFFRDGVWSVVGPDTPNTFTVVYDSGWPADRPNASHVFAVGHTSAPSWLIADDIWFEVV